MRFVLDQLRSPTTLSGTGLGIAILWLAVLEPLGRHEELRWQQIAAGVLGAAFAIAFAMLTPDQPPKPPEEPKP
jgi:hypothetical protein